MVLPNWLLTPAQPEISPESLVRPSDPAENDGHKVRTAESLALRARALQHGTLVHRLLQSLPDVQEDRREEAAQRFLARHADRLSAKVADSLIGEVLAILGRTDFAPLFAAGSKAEVPIVGRIERAGRTALEISGQIDRLVVTESDILIADFKTDRNPKPDSAVAGGYAAQLALYGALLGRLYPGRALRAGLIWTEIPRFDEIARDSLEREAGRLGVMLS
jgi:ATP-dependent helicase/nuclease subunit A